MSSFNHSSSGMTSSDSLASEEVPSNKTYIEHALYNQLADLEVFVSRFVTQGEVLFKDHQILCKKAKDTRVSLTSYLSENDEFLMQKRKSVGESLYYLTQKMILII